MEPGSGRLTPAKEASKSVKQVYASVPEVGLLPALIPMQQRQEGKGRDRQHAEAAPA